LIRMKKRLNGFLGLGVLIASFCVVLASCNKSKDPNAQLNAELKVIDDYLTTNSFAYSEILYTEVPIGITTVGGGPQPLKGQMVTLYYTVRLFPSGTLVKNDTLTNATVDDINDIGLASVAFIPGGSTATVFVPSPHAYGSTGDATLGVPPNTSLTYDITLVDVKRTIDQETQFQTDQDRIQSYVDTVKGPPVIKLQNGVWMQTNVAGTGATPKLYDYVSFQYKGYVMTTNALFDSQTLPTVPLLNLIEGLRQGMPNMREGGSATFYIPSLYAYGTAGTSSIPANAPLIFKITLNGINK